MIHEPLTLEWLPGRYAVCRLDPSAAVPNWAGEPRGLVSHTRTDRELSIVIDESSLPEALPAGVQLQRSFAALRVVGTLDFGLVGVLSRLTSALAAADVPVFVISTYDTDILLVRAEHRARAIAGLAAVADVSRLRAG